MDEAIGRRVRLAKRIDLKRARRAGGIELQVVARDDSRSIRNHVVIGRGVEFRGRRVDGLCSRIPSAPDSPRHGKKKKDGSPRTLTAHASPKARPMPPTASLFKATNRWIFGVARHGGGNHALSRIANLYARHRFRRGVLLRRPDASCESNQSQLFRSVTWVVTDRA